MALQPGVVRDAIRGYLRREGKKGATIAAIHAAVTATVGRPVAASSVRSYLVLNTPGQFQRIGRGIYRLQGGR